jgi:hypothetical protein
MTEVFDLWPEKYDQWLETPIGQLIKSYESELILNLLVPRPIPQSHGKKVFGPRQGCRGTKEGR